MFQKASLLSLLKVEIVWWRVEESKFAILRQFMGKWSQVLHVAEAEIQVLLDGALMSFW